MKKIFIFKPVEAWRYCGGGRVCIADSFDAAAAYWPTDKMLVNEPLQEDVAKDPYGFFDHWVLVATYSVAENDPPYGIVLDNWNWS